MTRAPAMALNVLRTPLIAAACALAIVACGGPSPEPVEVPAGLSEDAAVTELLQAKYTVAKAAPGRADGHLDLGLALGANGLWSLAESSFQNALAIDPDDPEVHHQMALLHGRRGDLEAQEAALRRSLELDPDFPASEYALACALLDGGELDAAKALFSSLERRSLDYPLGKLGLGMVELEGGDPGTAVALLEGVLQLVPNDPAVRFQLGRAYRLTGNGQRAEAMLGQAQEAGLRPILQSPGTARAETYRVGRAERLLVASSLMTDGNYDQAVPVLRKSIGRIRRTWRPPTTWPLPWWPRT